MTTTKKKKPPPPNEGNVRGRKQAARILGRQNARVLFEYTGLWEKAPDNVKRKAKALADAYFEQMKERAKPKPKPKPFSGSFYQFAKQARDQG